MENWEHVDAIERYKCFQCPGDVRHYRYGDLSERTYFSLKHKGVKYYFIFDTYPSGTKGFALWDNNYPLVAWDFFPDITPFNAEEKLKTILVFL